MESKDDARGGVAKHGSHSTQSIRRLVLEESHRRHCGHLMSNLCAAPVLSQIFNRMGPEDRFVLSKGHAALALYCLLFLRGIITREQLERTTTHPDSTVPGVEFSAGSLGMGICYAVGLCLSKRLRGEPGRVYVLVSDGECDEGSTWEAVGLANRLDLENLVIYVDANGQKAMGKADTAYDLNRRFKAFEANSHVVVTDSGVSFIRGIDWHYLPMNDEQFAQAMAEIG